jgi:deoxycytidylate deaminase
MGRPSWDLSFLTQCFLIAQRSIDTSTKCGAIIVDSDYNVLSQGYNNPIKNSIDSEIPMTRPEKYYHMIHAEENAILAYNGSKQDISGATIYQTGAPCSGCLRKIIQKGITRVVYPKFPLAVCQDEKDVEACNLMLKHHPNVEICELDVISDIHRLFDISRYYIDTKISSCIPK